MQFIKPEVTPHDIQSSLKTASERWATRYDLIDADPYPFSAQVIIWKELLAKSRPEPVPVQEAPEAVCNLASDGSRAPPLWPLA